MHHLWRQYVTTFFFFLCIRYDDHAKSSGQWLIGSPLSAVVRQLFPRAWCQLSVFWPKLLAYCPQVWAGLKNVLRSLLLRATFTVGWISKTQFLQWPVRRLKMMVWVLLSRVLIWSFCGSYPSFFSHQANFCFRRVLISLYEVERWGWGRLAAAFASLSAMPTCAGTHRSTTLLLVDRAHKLLCSCWMGRSVRDWRADTESESRTMFCWLQSSSISCSVAAFRARSSVL